MKIGRKRILLVAFALVSVVGLGGFYLRPQPGMCVKRDMMFWRTNVRAVPVRDNVYMLSVYGTDLISGNTAALTLLRRVAKSLHVRYEGSELSIRVAIA